MNDRVLEALRSIIAGEIRKLGLLGVYEYQVDDSSGLPPGAITISAHPADPNIGLPPLHQIAVRSAIGGTMKPNVGGSVHVCFLDGNPAKPVIVGGDVDVKYTFLDASDVGPPAVRGVARVGDSVAGGVITSGSTKVFA